MCIISMAKTIGDTLNVRCREAVRISASLLWEVPLYKYMHVEKLLADIDLK